jgi:NADPH-dependent 2,4-dienoyl-CoA reductase/sulfur reductase-like enzyme/rhodanese-related sulfurtransferase
MNIVIIGGVATGCKVAARMRRLTQDSEITIVEKGDVVSYASCGMPYFVGGDIADYKRLMDTAKGKIRDASYFMSMNAVKVLNCSMADQIDRKGKTVSIIHTVSGKKTTLPYDYLVLATGGSPVELPIEGKDLNHVFRMSHPKDALALKTFIQMQQPKRAVIIGGGLIGVEMIEALAKQGLRVTILEVLPRILPGLIDEEMSAYLMKYLQSKGVDVRSKSRVTRIEGDDSGNVRKVIMDGTEISTDLVLIAAGVRANSTLARNAGLKIGEHGDVWVNEYLQTSDASIYAGGDCVCNTHILTGKQVYAPMGSTANKHGRIIANNIMGYGEKFVGILGTAVIKIFGYNVGKVGLTEEQAKEAKFDVMSSLVPSTDLPHYYPTSRNLLIKMIADRKSKVILGVQAVGEGEAVKRIDVAAAMISSKATIDDVANLDLGYAPPFSTALDIIAHAANILRNQAAGLVKFISPGQVHEMMGQGEDLLFLDVRPPDDFRERRIYYPNVRLVPFGKLRDHAQDLPKDKRIIIICRSGHRAYEAQRILERFDFPQVMVLSGGLDAWPYDIVSGD